MGIKGSRFLKICCYIMVNKSSNSEGDCEECGMVYSFYFNKQFHKDNCSRRLATGDKVENEE